MSFESQPDEKRYKMGKFSSLKRKKKSGSKSSVNSENKNSVPADSAKHHVSSYLDYSDSEFDECEEYPYERDTDLPG